MKIRPPPEEGDMRPFVGLGLLVPLGPSVKELGSSIEARSGVGTVEREDGGGGGAEGRDGADEGGGGGGADEGEEA